MACLYRTNAVVRSRNPWCAGVFLVVVGGLRFYDRREIKDVLGYLRLLINPLTQSACCG